MDGEGQRRDVGCELQLDVATDAVLVLQVAAARTAGRVTAERLIVTNDNGAPGNWVEVPFSHGGRSHIVTARPGLLQVTYEATLQGAPPDTAAPPQAAIDEEEIVSLRPSRYCPSDAIAGFAGLTFPERASGADVARAVGSWVFEHLLLSPVGGRQIDSAVDILLAGTGVCRDFAHLAIALCRARGVAARFASVYAPGLSPMDFHAVTEVRTEQGWEVLDPTRRAPRSSLIRIATGRDAADAAFVTTLRGAVEFVSVNVVATTDGPLPNDDHVSVVRLA